MTSPTQRTLKVLRDRGMLCDVVERWVPGARIRKDLFGFIDIVALSSDQVIGIQCTSGTNHGARVKKIREQCSEAAGKWVKAGGRIEVWSWRKVKVRPGGKAVRWEPRVEEVVL